MSTIHHASFLRRALLIDAGISSATGLIMFGGASFLTRLLIIPEALLRSAGLALLPFAVFVAVVATREQVPSAAVWIVIVINVLWTIGSVALLLSGAVTPSLLGYVFVLFQASAVAVFAALHVLGLRRSQPRLA